MREIVAQGYTGGASQLRALATRFAAVRMDAAKLLKPNVVQAKLSQRTLNDADEVRTWLTEVEQLLLTRVAKGPLAF